jgi:hypothetical protein
MGSTTPFDVISTGAAILSAGETSTGTAFDRGVDAPSDFEHAATNTMIAAAATSATGAERLAPVATDDREPRPSRADEQRMRIFIDVM